MGAEELVEKNVEELKKAVNSREEIDLKQLLKAEKQNRDRENVKDFLKEKMKEKDLEKHEEIVEGGFESVRKAVSNGLSPEKLLEAEKRTEDRQRVKDWLRDRLPSSDTIRVDEERREAVEKLQGESSGRYDSIHIDDAEVLNENVEVSEEFKSRIEEHRKRFNKASDMIGEVIVGQEDVVEKVLIALICDGNVLLEGVPGLGKSLLVETLSRVTSSETDFNRIQFVPDMLPSDILGQRVYNQEKGEFYINKGPVFTNFLLADEINRAPPKTQAAMMEVMQEKKVSIEKEEFELEPPYLVLATQNPLEQKGTYPLPEAVIDRFFLKVVMDYPEDTEEMEILKRNSIKDSDPFENLENVISKDEILQAQKDVRDVHISDDVRKYIVEIIATARDERDYGVNRMKYVDYGPSPRASIWLSMGASAYAILNGRTYVLPDDVKKIAEPVLRHRILLNYEGKISKYDSTDVVQEILDKVDKI